MGDVASLISVLSRFGDLGLVVAFFIWWNIWTAKRYDKAEERHRLEMSAQEERRLNFDKDRLAVDREIASSIAALNSTIQSRGLR